MIQDRDIVMMVGEYDLTTTSHPYCTILGCPSYL